MNYGLKEMNDNVMSDDVTWLKNTWWTWSNMSGVKWKLCVMKSIT